jgi:Tfp pilus assembly protein PilO
MMHRDFTLRKRAIVVALALFLAADVALAAYAWNLGSAQSAQQQLAALQREEALLKADIARARSIQGEMPAIQKDCDQFESSFFPESSGYSSVTAELSAIAAKAGLSLDARGFHGAEVKGHGLREIIIEASVSGTYRDLVLFLNGLQRSPNMYAIESLSARPDNQKQGLRGGSLRVGIHLKTYFRAAS